MYTTILTSTSRLTCISWLHM